MFSSVFLELLARKVQMVPEAFILSSKLSKASVSGGVALASLWNSTGL